MFRKTLAVAAIALSTLSTPTVAQDLTESGWWVDGISNSRNSDYALMVYRAVNNNGTLAICGSIFNSGISNRLLRDAVGNYLISLDNTPLLRNINSFSRVSSEESLGQSYECVDTQVAWYEGANERLSARLTKRRY